MKDSNNIEWTCTDPDNKQYGRMVSEGTYEFKEWIGGGLEGEDIENTVKECFNNPNNWEQKTISLVDYNEQEIDDVVNSYYENLADVKEIYGDDWMWIVAECIFEQESGLY